MPLHLVPRSLHYLEQVAQLGSIQAASRETGISASAIHRQIASIEEDLGEPLFERDSKGMSLTATGRMVLDVARNWRMDSSKLWSLIQANRGVEHGHIRIATMESMTNGLAIDLVKAVNAQFPQVQLELAVTTPDQAIKGTLNGEYDFAIVANAAPRNGLEFHWRREFPLGCIAAPSHSVATRTRLSFREFVAHKVVFQAATLPIRKLLEAHHSWLFEEAKQQVVVSSPQLLKLLVVSGDYLAITSQFDVAPELKDGRLLFVPISDRDVFQQSISVLTNAQMPVPPLVRKIMDIVAQLAEQQIVAAG